jgi:hypothetical protein
MVAAALALGSLPSSGQNILSVTGNPIAGWVVIFNGQAFASSWTQSNSFTNVTVSAGLSSFGVPGQTGRAYLTRRLGPDTTPADQVASAQFAFPLEAGDVPLFTGLTLLPGRYYLSMIGNGDSGSGWSTGCPAKVDAADGVALGLDYGLFGLASYLPASSTAPQPNIFTRLKVFAETNGPASPPPIPFQSHLRAYTTPSEILLTWDPVAGADHYEVQRAGDDLRWKTAADHVTTAQFRDGDYTWFPTYYRVITVKVTGEHYVSETVSAPWYQPGVELSGLSVRPVSETSVSIDWEVNHPLRNQPGLSPGARVLLEVGLSSTELATVQWTSTYAEFGQFVLAGLAPSTAYWYRLTFTGNNDSGFTYLNQFTTRAAVPVEHTIVSVPNVSPNLVTDEDTPIAFSLVSDDPLQLPTVFTITMLPNHGTLTGEPPELLYTPSPDWDGLDVIGYSAFDGISTHAGVVIVTLRPVNDAPVALEPILAWAQEDTPGPLPLEGRELDSLDAVTGFTIVSGPEHGTFQGGLYTPDPNFSGIDHLTYRASDGRAEGNIATVRIRVEAVNDPPVASDQTVTVLQDTPTSIVLQASDPEGVLLGMFFQGLPLHGTLSAPGIEVYDANYCHGLSDLVYTPAPGYNGPDGFSYVVYDGAYSASATVAIQVISPNRPPQAVGQSVTTEFAVPLTVILSGSDPDGDPVTYSVVSGPLHGSLSGTVPGLLYTPAPGYSGQDTFRFTVNDGRLTSDLATVVIIVMREDDIPMGPSSLVAAASSGHRINLSWADRSRYEKGYRIERSADGINFKQIASVNADVSAFSDTGVQAGKSYSYRVRAYNKAGNSAYSNQASAVALP